MVSSFKQNQFIFIKTNSFEVMVITSEVKSIIGITYELPFAIMWRPQTTMSSSWWPTCCFCTIYSNNLALDTCCDVLGFWLLTGSIKVSSAYEKSTCFIHRAKEYKYAYYWFSSSLDSPFRENVWKNIIVFFTK